MTTPIKSLSTHCGMTQDEAADFLGTPMPTMKSWCTGKRNAPKEPIAKLHALSAHLDTLAAKLTTAINRRTKTRKTPPAKIILRTITEDKDAREIGLPYASTHGAILARVLAGLPPESLSVISFAPSGPDVEDVEII